MKFPSIRIEGAILAADMLDRIETGDLVGQKPADFGLASDVKVKDEIVRAWTDGQDLWRIFRRTPLSAPPPPAQKLNVECLPSEAPSEGRLDVFPLSPSPSSVVRGPVVL